MVEESEEIEVSLIAQSGVAPSSGAAPNQVSRPVVGESRVRTPRVLTDALNNSEKNQPAIYVYATEDAVIAAPILNASIAQDFRQ